MHGIRKLVGDWLVFSVSLVHTWSTHKRKDKKPFSCCLLMSCFTNFSVVNIIAFAFAFAFALASQVWTWLKANHKHLKFNIKANSEAREIWQNPLSGIAFWLGVKYVWMPWEFSLEVKTYYWRRRPYTNYQSFRDRLSCWKYVFFRILREIWKFYQKPV